MNAYVVAATVGWLAMMVLAVFCFRRLTKLVLRILLVIFAIFLTVAALLFVSLAWKYTSKLESHLADPTVLKGSQVIYQHSIRGIETIASGDDSTLYSIHKFADSQLAALYGQTVVFKDCHRDTYSCSTAPTWRARASYLKSGSTFDDIYISNIPSIAASYHAIASDTATVCAKETIPEFPDDVPRDQPQNGYLVCLNTHLHVVTFEYISSQDAESGL